MDNIGDKDGLTKFVTDINIYSNIHGKLTALFHRDGGACHYWVLKAAFWLLFKTENVTSSTPLLFHLEFREDLNGADRSFTTR